MRFWSFGTTKHVGFMLGCLCIYNVGWQMSFWQIPTRPVRSSLMCNESSVAVVEVVEMVDVVVVFGIVE